MSHFAEECSMYGDCEVCDELEVREDSDRRSKPANLSWGNLPIPFKHPTVGMVEDAYGDEDWFVAESKKRYQTWSDNIDGYLEFIAASNIELGIVKQKGKLRANCFLFADDYQKMLKEAESNLDYRDYLLKAAKEDYKSLLITLRKQALYHATCIAEMDDVVAGLERNLRAAEEQLEPSLAAMVEHMDCEAWKPRAEAAEARAEKLLRDNQKLAKRVRELESGTIHD